MELQTLASMVVPMLAQSAITIQDTVAVKITETPKEGGTVLYIACAAVALAFIAICISSYEAWANRRHNRLSVKPAVTIQRVLGNPEGSGLFLANFGVGPAIIKKIIYSVIYDISN